VEGDAQLILSITDFLESLPQLPSLPLLPSWSRSRSDGTTTTNAGRNNNKQQQQQSRKRLINTKLTSAAREFMSRIFEELDYRNEAKNIELFASLYSSERRCKIANHGGGIVPSTATNTNNIEVIVPKVYSSWCTENILIMEWIDGTKLTNVVDNNGGEETTTMTKIKTNAENLALVKVAIDATLNQLLVTGVLHADPHAGNLLKVRRADGSLTLAYLDFGLVSSIPNQVRDALICAVVLQIFERNVSSVSSLFGELQLIPQYILDNKVERLALEDALRITFDNSLLYPTTTTIDDVQKQQKQGNSRTQSRNPTVKDATTMSSTTMIPELKFDKLLDSLSRLIPRFEFDLPPYFINNARALSTLEGIAKSLDPTFNVLTIMYPYAINRLLINPTQSPIVDRTVQTLIRNSVDGTIDRCKIRRLLQDSSSISGLSKRHLLWTIIRTRPGRKLTRTIVREELGQYLIKPGMRRSRQRRGSQWATNGTKAPKKNTKWYLLPL
jgi:predicted unusual protein kinase regulating ubiquinone biosynthesis (AarF/ABC1/UbiB family)